MQLNINRVMLFFVIFNCRLKCLGQTAVGVCPLMPDIQHNFFRSVRSAFFFLTSCRCSCHHKRCHTKRRRLFPSCFHMFPPVHLRVSEQTYCILYVSETLRTVLTCTLFLRSTMYSHVQTVCDHVSLQIDYIVNQSPFTIHIFFQKGCVFYFYIRLPSSRYIF